MKPKNRDKLKKLISTLYKNSRGEAFEATNSQAEMFLAIIDPKIKWLWQSASTRFGKEISDNTPVLTTSGWKNHGDLRVGDSVFNEQGEAKKVLMVHPKTYSEYEITFSNGEKIECHGQHEWVVQHRRRWEGYKFIETNWLANQKLQHGNGARWKANVFFLPKIKPVNFEKKKLPFDPYTLGVWLGDGVSKEPSITIHPKDWEIIKSIPYKVSSIQTHKKTGVKRFCFWRGSFISQLRELNLLGNKHIPNIYKFSSIKQRSTLLAGLIDTDGSVAPPRARNYIDGRVSFVNTNKRLIDDVAEIITSLGMRYSLTRVEPTTSSSGIKGKKPVYILAFISELGIPTVLKRKKIFWRKKNKRISIKSIKKIKPKLRETKDGMLALYPKGNCITVDGGIYLVGKKLIPTHNSDILAMAILYLASVKKLKIPVVAGTQEKANKIMEYVISHISDSPILFNKLLNADLDKTERLKIQMSKQGLRWAHGGWIYITSVESRTISKEGEGVIGEGGDVVVLEEAGLIRSEEQFSKVVRMPEETRGWGKLIMSGNCIENSVFEKAYLNPLYHKVRVPLSRAIKEGRFTQKYLEEKKSQTTAKDWKRYYLVKFPQASEYAYFKAEKYGVLPKEMIYSGAVDPSLGEAKKGSKTGIVVLGVDEKGQCYEVESIERSMGPDEIIRTILNMPYEFDRFGIEDVLFQKYFLKVIRQKSQEMGKYIPFVGIGQVKKKEERIESLEPFINTGQILFKGDNDLWDRMLEYPDTDYLDVLDALEMAWRLARQVGAELGRIRRPGPPSSIPPSAVHRIDPRKFVE